MNSSVSCARSASAFIPTLFLIFCVAHAARAATVPAGFTDTLVATNLTNATAFAIAPDGRIFVCLQDGNLRVVKNGALLPTPFLTVTVSASGERGLLGVAFDPNFATNNYVYVYYTATTPAIHNRVSRFTASGDVAVAGSETVLLDLDNLSAATNHNGGAMHFGADGKLYIAVGENGTPSNSQTLANLLGKMLRIDPDGSMPADNPFFNTATGRNRAIWALGLRNPYTFNFQPGTGRMFINDVGQNAVEEINDGIAGSNYGWPTCEGSCSNSNFRNPLFQYGHGFTSTTGCAITGGAFYNPTTEQFPSTYTGKYFFADFCSNWIRLFDPASGTASDFASGASSPVDLQVSTDGSLYYLQRGANGQLRRIQYPAGQVPPSFGTHPQSQTVAAGQSVTFTASASGSTPLTLRWQRNNVDIPGANGESYTITSASASDNGAQFRCVATNAFGTATSNTATLTVTTTTPLPNARDVLITEYRLDGPGGLRDEFVELYNNTSEAVTVSTSDGSAGWALVTGRDGASGVALETYLVVPTGTVIPARGHYLVAGSAYSLSAYGGTGRALADLVSQQGDLSGDDDAHPFRGLALFRTAEANNFTTANRLDAVGGACADARLSEGRVAGLCRNVGTAESPAANYSLVRRRPAGVPQDTDNNADDFVLVAVESPLQSAGTGTSLASELGSPAPENLNSPIEHNATIKASLVDPQVASTSPPNRVRAGGQIPNGQFGTLTIRRRFTNKTGRTVTALRFRLTGITTLGTPVVSAPQADLRATSSSDAEVQTTAGNLIAVKGTILEQPPAQTLGGGLNSSLVVPLTGGALIPNASVDVQFVLGVQQEGSFRFFVNVEAVTQPAVASTQKRTSAKANRRDDE